MPKEEPTLGRPSSYNKKFDRQALKLTQLGYTDKQLAEFFEVAESTIYAWKNEFRSFRESIKKGKAETDAGVAGQLLKRAMGYKIKEVAFEKVDTKEALEATKDGDIVKVDLYRKKILLKDIAPDVLAQIFWLKNRQPELWRDKKEVDSNVKITDMQIGYGPEEDEDA